MGGQGLFLIAAKQNKAIILMYLAELCIGDTARSNAILFQHVEAVHESCERGHYVAGLLLLSFCSIHHPVWEAAHGIAAKAPNAALRQWAHKTWASFHAHKLLLLLDSNPSPETIAELFDRCDFFSYDPLTNNRMRFIFCTVADVHVDGELVDLNDVSERLDVVVVLACHAVKKHSLPLLKYILAAATSN